MVAVITGASKGIGKALAEKFAKEGFDLAICARSESSLLITKNDLQQLNNSITVLALPFDLSRKEEAILFGHKVLQQFQRVDVLINNAGQYLPGDISTEAEGTLETMIQTNLYSAYHLTRTLLPSMIANQKGHIFNISSIAALKAYSNGGAYSISKFALEGFSQNLREEMKPFNIKVSTINPGATMSDSWSGSGIDENRIMQAKDIAEVIWSAYNLSKQAVVEQIVLRPQLGDL